MHPRAKNYLVLILALGLIAGVTVAWNQRLELVRLRAEALGDGSQSDLQKRLLDLRKRNNELEAELAHLRAGEIDESMALLPGEGGDDSAPAEGRQEGFRRRDDNRRDFADGLASLLGDPEFAKLWSGQMKTRLLNANADLIKKLNLSPDEALKFADLLVERQLAAMDVLSAARAEGLTGRESRDEIRDLVRQVNTDINDQIKALLGDDRYSQYRNYQQTRAQRAEVAELDRRLGYAGMSLQNYQTETLVQILAETSPQAQGGNRFGGGRGGFDIGRGGILVSTVAGAVGSRGGGGGTTITNDAVTRAQTVLSPAQLDVFKQMQQEQNIQRQIADLMKEGRRNLNGRTIPDDQGSASAAPARPPKG